MEDLKNDWQALEKELIKFQVNLTFKEKEKKYFINDL